MADDPHNPHDRLERHAQQPVPPLDPAFANRLESQLRIGHADATSPRPWAVRSVVPRLAAAVALVVAGVAGIVSLTTDDAGVPVAVIDDGQPALLDAPSIDDGALPVDVTVTPTPTPVDAQGLNEAPVQSAVPTATPPALITPPATTPPDAPNVEPTAGAGAPTDPTPTSLPTQSTTPLASATPTGSPTPTQVPATPVAAEPTVLPVPTATALPEPTPASTPEPRPTATATATPEIETAPIELTCAPRSTGDAVGVVCTWVAPVTDRTVAWYEVLRSRNGAEAEIVARQRVDESTSYVDRNVVSGDEATYLVQARNADDQVVGASIRQIVQVP